MLHPEPITEFSLAFKILVFAFVVEGITLVIAVRSVLYSAKSQNLTFFGYLQQGSDPTGVAVILEDGVAVLGVVIAGIGLYLSMITDNPFWDSIATIIIGLLLGLVAIFITYRTKGLLLGQSIPLVSRNKVLNILKNDPIVESVYDIKTAIMGVDDLRFKAEIEFNGEALSEKYLKNMNFDKELSDMNTHEKQKQFLILYGNHIIEYLGDEINRIEAEIMRQMPEIKHIDIEVN